MNGPSLTSRAGAAPDTGQRRRIAARTRLDFWFDAVLLLGYTLAYSYGFTGIAIHEWLGIGLALLIHLTVHWDWVTYVVGNTHIRPTSHHIVSGRTAGASVADVATFAGALPSQPA